MLKSERIFVERFYDTTPPVSGSVFEEGIFDDVPEDAIDLAWYLDQARRTETEPSCEGEDESAE